MSIRSIKPARKRYTDYQFKNRLEAQWAVFFALIGIPWEYTAPTHLVREEYRPEFWLSSQHCWMQIKEVPPSEEEFIKAADLAFSAHTWVAIAWGEVGEHQMYAFYPPFYDLGYYKDFDFALCQRCQNLMLACPVHDDDHYCIGFCYRCREMVVQKADAFPSRTRLLMVYNTARKVELNEEKKPCNRLPRW